MGVRTVNILLPRLHASQPVAGPALLRWIGSWRVRVALASCLLATGLAAEAGAVGAGAEAEPQAQPAAGDDLVAAMAELEEAFPTDAGTAGSFGTRLERPGLKFEPYLHAYATLNLIGVPETPAGAPNPTAWSFDQHYFNVFVGADMGPVRPELQLELEHGNEISTRFAQVDLTVSPLLIVRVGIFLVPFGTFNEYLYPEYVRPLPRRPLTLVLDRVVPVVWSDVGLQARGSGEVGLADLSWNYAVYVGNGLQLRDPTADPTDLRNMRNNFRETASSNKAVGGRLGVARRGLYAGASVNHGGYAFDPADKLLLVGADAGYESAAGGILLEWAFNRIDLPQGGRFVRQGVALQGWIAVTDWLRPGAMVDWLNEPELSRVRAAPVLAVYPAPETAPLTSVRAAVARSFGVEGELPSDETTYLLELATAF